MSSISRNSCSHLRCTLNVQQRQLIGGLSFARILSAVCTVSYRRSRLAQLADVCTHLRPARSASLPSKPTRVRGSKSRPFFRYLACLTLLMAGCALNAAAQESEAADSYNNDCRSDSDCPAGFVELATWPQLVRLSELGTSLDIHLVADIDAQGKNALITIPTAGTVTVHGNGYRIENYQGGLIFGDYSGELVIENLHLVSLQQGHLVGGFCSWGSSIIIRNSSVTGTVAGAAFVPTVCREVKVDVINSYVHASVTGCAPRQYSSAQLGGGGFIGVGDVLSEINITGSHFKGSVAGECEGVGGLIGYIYGELWGGGGYISNSYVEGLISNSSPTGSVGGLVGTHAYEGDPGIRRITDSYFQGMLGLLNQDPAPQEYWGAGYGTNCTGDKRYNPAAAPRFGIGGLVGDSSQSLPVERSYANASIFAFDCIGGLFGVTRYASIEDSYAVSRFINQSAAEFGDAVKAKGGLVGQLAGEAFGIQRSYGSIIDDESLPASWAGNSGGIFGHDSGYFDNGLWRHGLVTDSVYVLNNDSAGHYNWTPDPDCDPERSIFCDLSDFTAHRSSDSIRYKNNVAGFNFTGDNPIWTNVEGKTAPILSWQDDDRDGIPAYLDDDKDNDGIKDVDDDMPLDTDNDGSDNVWDPDDDNDGVNDVDSDWLPLDAFPLNSAASVDTDGDGAPDTWNSGCDAACQSASLLVLDAFPTIKAGAVDTDGDGQPDDWTQGCDQACINRSQMTLDLDDDGDGYTDDDELTNNQSDPKDANSTPPDADFDFVSDLNDPDDDNDGVSDSDEVAAGTDPLTLESAGLKLSWLNSSELTVKDCADRTDCPDPIVIPATVTTYNASGDPVLSPVVAIKGSAFIFITPPSGISLPEGLQTIGDSSFLGDYDSSILRSLIIPSTVSAIESSAFLSAFDRSNAGTLIFKGARPTSLAADAFGDNVPDPNNDDPIPAGPGLDWIGYCTGQSGWPGDPIQVGDDGAESDPEPNDYVLLTPQPDCDGDRVLDADDAFDNDPNESVDSDGDGLGDNADQCDSTPSAEAGDINAEGCGASERDTDGDEVNDNLDACPNTPSQESVDAQGCSDTQKDDDGDGVNNATDSCPDTSAAEVGLVNAQGCGPSERDTDGDGVNDNLDAFPNNPNETLDSDGDGFGDNEEIEAGTDPNDPNDQPVQSGLPIWLLYEASKP